MTKITIIVADEKNAKLTEFSTEQPTLFNPADKGKKYNISIKEPNLIPQYVGTYNVGMAEGTTPTPPTPPTPTCPPGQHWDAAQGKCVPDIITPPEPPIPPTGDVLYDSKIHSKLHDGQVRSVTQEGNINAGGLGCECRASGGPKLVVNADKTFSLVTGAGHGRFYGYVINYNATLEIECAFWNQSAGQDLSLKIRSRHNEGGAEENRFGGYGFSLDRSGWGSKVEQFHNEHSESVSGSLPSKPVTQQYFKVEFTAKDEGDKVRITAKYNGSQVMSRLVKKYQTEALFMKNSYYWVRSNVDSGSSEIRIKQIRILKA